MVLVKESVYTIKDYVMIVTGAIHHVKFQWQTILGFSQQRMNGVLEEEQKYMLWVSGLCIIAM